MRTIDPFVGVVLFAVPPVPGGRTSFADGDRWAPEDLPYEAVGDQRGPRQVQILVVFYAFLPFHI